MSNKEKGLLSLIFGGGKSNTRILDLVSKRAVHPDNGQLMAHAISRHIDWGDRTPTWPDGNRFGQGSKFPPHVRPGDVTKLEKEVRDQFCRHMKGLNSQVVGIQRAGDAYRITVRVDKYGVELVGSFIRNGQVSTVFPEDD